MLARWKAHCRQCVTLVVVTIVTFTSARAQLYRAAVHDLGRYKQQLLDTSRLDVRYSYRVLCNPAEPKDTLADQQQLLLGGAVAWYRSRNLADYDSLCTDNVVRGRDWCQSIPRGASGEWVYRGYPRRAKAP